jgi:hypothetical protein
MKRRELSFLCLGLGAGIAATVIARGHTSASYFVLRWTSPGREGPKPGGSR